MLGVGGEGDAHAARPHVLTRTTTQILESLRDPANAEMWRQFDDRYRPVLVAFARRQGLGEEDAADAAQTTLMQFSADYVAGRYDRSRGRLRSWIIGIARNRITDMGRSRQKHAARSLEASAEGAAPVADAEADWEESVRRVILERAMHVLRHETRLDERTVRAFDMCALRNVPPEAAAAECGMTVAEVYVAKNRAIKKLREIVENLTREFDEE